MLHLDATPLHSAHLPDTDRTPTSSGHPNIAHVTCRLSMPTFHFRSRCPQQGLFSRVSGSKGCLILDLFCSLITQPTPLCAMQCRPPAPSASLLMQDPSSRHRGPAGSERCHACHMTIFGACFWAAAAAGEGGGSHAKRPWTTPSLRRWSGPWRRW